MSQEFETVLVKVDAMTVVSKKVPKPAPASIPKDEPAPKKSKKKD